MASWGLFSLYTINTPYEEQIKRLKRSIERFNVESHILGIPDEGSWYANVNLKQTNILKKIKEIKKPLLWVDADAEFIRYPQLIDELSIQNYDIACHRMEVDSDIVSSGTIYFNYNEQTINFIEKWVDLCKARIDKGELTHSVRGPFISMEQEVFGNLIDEYLLTKKLRIYNLPADYYAIEDFDGGLHKNETYDIPAIIHHQASRQFRENLYK